MQLPILSQYSGKRICVALSGGRDSVALAHYLKSNAEAYGFSVCAVTCEHGIRGEESLRDLAFVEELCRAWNLPLSVFRADIPAIAKESGRGVEEEGREFRYVCFELLVEEGFADLIATAHHQDDVAETVLFRLVRGTSSFGLGTVSEWEFISRPFRNVSRRQIDDYIALHNLPFIEDSSNADCAYARNLIRNCVMPYLTELSPSATAHLAEFANRVKEDDEYLQALAQEQIVRTGEERKIPLSLPVPLFTRACVIAIKEMGVTRDYTSAHVEDLRALAQLQSGKRICLPQGVLAYREGETIVFCREKGQIQAQIPFCEGEFSWEETRLQISAEALDGALYADADAFPDGCVIRARQEGDVFQPFGGSEKKLKEYLTNKKIPARVGRTLPLVVKGGEVYAIFGVEISEKVKVTQNTSRKIYLRVK